MSNPFFDDVPPRRPGGGRPAPPAAPSRRPRALLITVGVLLALFIGVTAFSSLWTERLWYGSIGFSSVFSTLIWTRVGLFLVFGALMALAVGGSMVVAYRLRPAFRPGGPDQLGLERYRDAVLPIRWVLLVGVSLLLGSFAGTSAAGNWRTYLLWRNGGSFGTRDQWFKKDAGFYVFDLPWYHFLTDFVMATAVVALLAAVLVHYLFGGIQFVTRNDRFSPGAQAQVSVLVAIFVLAKAVDYWLDRYDTLSASGGLIDGVTYTDEHAVIPAHNILAGIALICAVLFLVNLWRRNWMLPTVGVALLALSAILLGMVWPGVVQRFQVAPSEGDKEQPYIQANIDATRTAYDINDVEETSYRGSVEVEEDQLRDDALAAGIRLVDPKLVSETFEQTQQIKGYYSVPTVLDVDRYPIDGEQRDVVLAVRELNQAGLPESAQNWNNLRTVYTHGYGLIAAYGNQRDRTNDSQAVNRGDGGLAWAEEDIPPRGQLTELAGDEGFEDTNGKPGYRGQIYFGEQSPTYSIVGKRDGAQDIELDLPEGESGAGGENYSTYEGTGGVGVGSLWRKLLYAVKFSEPAIVLSSRVNENSKILYDREPTQMVRKAAPWLTVDGDPFPAMVDGKIVWIVDGYTSTDQYPQAAKDSVEDMTSDSLGNDTAFRTVPTDEINYMRNAVKAVVDAYDGSVTLYEWDEKDPILKAWEKAFPGTVRPKSSIPDSLLSHMRYPEDLFKVQRYQLQQYHVTSADDWYQKNDAWQIPRDPNSDTSLQPPYRLSVSMPNEDGSQGKPKFSLTSVYTPVDRANLAAFLAVNADAADEENYGRMQLLALRGGQQVPGPGQISNNFAGDDAVKAALLSFTNDGSSKVNYGNLLTLPVGQGLMYVQPIYTIRTGGEGNYPQLRFVVVSFGDKVGFGSSLEEAVNDILGEAPGTGSGSGSGSDSGGTPTGTLDSAVAAELQQAIRQFRRADRLQREGDTAGWAAALEQAQEHVQRAEELAAEAGARPDEDEGSGNGDGGQGGE
ncbi:UPF0182 family protein [Nocardioides rotundus]|uniref:UPF0182 family membrane protein n=1 Tax=Nocardioides rotundus TaxID=1774216 RepID=UPI001CBEA35E|nr:UPF0182 family protein [Nocardioides rotundus]UAL28565.1 UPF0182 family protein [Nocardioides rotundus]